MARVCFILVAGLDGALAGQCTSGGSLDSFRYRSLMEPVIPAVTSTMQATLTTGVGPGQHGIIANGLYTFNQPELQRHLDMGSFAEYRRQTSFWEQSNALLEAPRFWTGKSTRVAMLFWQNSIPDSADVILTPKPEHTPDGKTLTACWSRPSDLYASLVAELGPFPLQTYWGPLAGQASTQWIVQAAIRVWNEQSADIQLVYIPFLDYNLQRLGPDDRVIATDLEALDKTLIPLLAAVRAEGGTAIVCGDYGITGVRQCIMPNRLLRAAGLLKTRPDDKGKLLVDYSGSEAFAMVDHQVAHIYCRADRISAVRDLFAPIPGVDRILVGSKDMAEYDLVSPRSGQVVALAARDTWFAHDWWDHDLEKPDWQFSVDIHRKPGYDPREMFIDAQRRCIAQDTGLVKGSHGVRPENDGKCPVVLSDVALPPSTGRIAATAVAEWLSELMG